MRTCYCLFEWPLQRLFVVFISLFMTTCQGKATVEQKASKQRITLSQDNPVWSRQWTRNIVLLLKQSRLARILTFDATVRILPSTKSMSVSARRRQSEEIKQSSLSRVTDWNGNLLIKHRSVHRTEVNTPLSGNAVSVVLVQTIC